MPLKFKIKARDEVPAEVQNLYVERDGVLVLDVEGAVDRGKLDEFRNTNVALLKERDELKQRFAGIDPEAVRQLAEEKRRLEEAQQLKAGEVEKVLEQRVRAARAELEQQVGTLTGEREALTARLTALEIEQATVTEATRRGLRPSAVPDIVARARSTFRLVNGVPQAVAADGRTPRLGRDGVTPLSVAEWIEGQVTEAPHLFEANAGGGGGGGGGATSHNGSGGAAGKAGRNPFRKETWNLTEQMRITKSDPALAARLKAAA